MYIQKHTNIFSSTFHLNQLIKRPNGIVIYLDSTVIEAFKKEVPLSIIKEMPELQNMALLKLSRLSVQPVTPEEFEIICKMSH